jgi:hypothetical protein
MTLDFGGRTLRDLAAEIDGDDFVRDRHDEAHVMLDEQYRHLLYVADTADLGLQPVDLLMIETGGRFVEK